MPPRPAPDLDRRRTDLVRTARALAEADGWESVTVRRLARELGATQTVVYSAFDGRDALVDACAVDGFAELAAALDAAPATFDARSRAYLRFEQGHRRTYEAMFLRPTRLPFATEQAPAALRRAFAALREVVPEGDDTVTEVVWATLHGLATLSSTGRLRQDEAETRLRAVERMVAGEAEPAEPRAADA